MDQQRSVAETADGAYWSRPEAVTGSEFNRERT